MRLNFLIFLREKQLMELLRQITQIVPKSERKYSKKEEMPLMLQSLPQFAWLLSLPIKRELAGKKMLWFRKFKLKTKKLWIILIFLMARFRGGYIMIYSQTGLKTPLVLDFVNNTVEGSKLFKNKICPLDHDSYSNKLILFQGNLEKPIQEYQLFWKLWN